MANPSGISAGFECLLIKKTTGRSITYDTKLTPDDNQVLDWNFTWNENYPKKLKLMIANGDPTAAVNLLNSACAEWDVGTQALVIGDDVQFSVYDDDGSHLTRLLRGQITEIRPTSDGIIEVLVEDRLAIFDHIYQDIIYGKEYYDQEVLDTATIDGIMTITGPTGADIATPFAKAAYAHTDIRRSMGGAAGPGGNTMQDTDWYSAQAFIAEGDGFIGTEVVITSNNFETAPAAVDGDMITTLQTDYNNRPSGVIIATVTTAVGANDMSVAYDVNFLSTNVPEYITPGERYWLVFSPSITGDATHWLRINDLLSTTYPIDDYFYDWGAGTWSEAAGNVLDVKIDQANYETQSPDTVYYDATGDDTYLFAMNTTITTVDTYYTLHRGKVSYFKNKLTLQEVMERLIKTNTVVRHDVDTNNDREIDVYRTNGKSIGECFRELADVFENSGTWNGRQHVAVSWYDSGLYYAGMNQRLNTDDTADFIISHPDDTANDDEHIIAGTPQISINTRLKYAKVIVEGKDVNGNPIIAIRSDQGLSGSTWEQMDGNMDTLVFSDPNIKTYEDANTQAYRILDSVTRDVWEGSIRLSGQFLMFEFDTSDANYGSGKIIRLNWSPLAIATTDMKVSGMTMGPGYTDIYVNNKDPLILNRKTRGWGRNERSESFAVPTEQEDVKFIQKFHDGTLTAPAYIRVFDSAGSELDNATKVDVTVYQSSDIYTGTDKYNLRTLVATLSPGNGYTKDTGFTGADPRTIGEIRVYNASDTLLATVDLITSAPDIDESIYKFKGQKVIIEINYNAT